MSLRKALRGDLGGQTTPLGTAWLRMARSRAFCKWMLRNKRRNMNKQNKLTSKNWTWLEEEDRSGAFECSCSFNCAFAAYLAMTSPNVVLDTPGKGLNETWLLLRTVWFLHTFFCRKLHLEALYMNFHTCVYALYRCI